MGTRNKYDKETKQRFYDPKRIDEKTETDKNEI